MLDDVDTLVSSGAVVADGPSAHRIVVGFDNSRSSYAALAWAAREGVARNRAVRVFACPAARPEADDNGTGLQQSVSLVSAVDEVQRQHPSLRVEAADKHFGPHDALLAEAVGAELVVVGASATGTAQRWLLGSVPWAVARRSSCPVVVVHGSGQEEVRRVVVGVDNSNAAGGALEWAIAEANLHGADVMVVHAWERPMGSVRSLRTDDLRRADASCALDIAVRACEHRLLQSVEGMLIEGDAAEILVAVTTSTDLLVVGSRGRSGFKTMLFGSVALSVMNDSDCPAVLVHPRLRPGFSEHVGGSL